jgi:Tfp pilus assembly protein FimV
VIPWLSPTLWLGVALAGALVFGGVQTVRLSGAKADTEKVRAQFAEHKATAEKTAREASDRYRQLERNYHERREEIQHERAKEQQAQQVAMDRLRADRNRLRNDIADYARGRGAAEDSVAACHRRAATLGELLEESLRVQEELAGAAESHSADVRALLKWARELKQ